MSLQSTIGMLIIAFAIAHNKWSWMALRNGFKTKGKIIDHKPDINFFTGSQHTREYPIVEYVDDDGQTKSDQMNTSNRLGKFKLGDEIEIVKFESKLHHYRSSFIQSALIASAGIILLVLDFIKN